MPKQRKGPRVWTENYWFRLRSDRHDVDKMALELLGFGPCHPMVEVMGNPAQPAHWDAWVAAQDIDWTEVFADCTSQADFPGASVWHELSIAFPDAKAIHTECPEEDRWASFPGTIGKFFALRESLPLPPPVAAIFETMDQLLVKGVMAGLDRDSSIAAYRRNNEKVRATIPAEKLLVFGPTDGWDPICRFLDLPVPSSDFSRSRARDDFWAHFGGEPAAA